MKKFFFAAALIVSGLLVGCNQLTQYTVSEQEINQALAKNNNFSKDIGLPGVAEAHIVLNNLASQIGREEPNKVTLTGDANLDMNSLFGSQKATMKLKLKALPVFNKEKGAIYLQEMEVVGRYRHAGKNAVGTANADALFKSVAAQLFQPAAGVHSAG